MIRVGTRILSCLAKIGMRRVTSYSDAARALLVMAFSFISAAMRALLRPSAALAPTQCGSWRREMTLMRKCDDGGSSDAGRAGLS